jgi:protein TonB
MAPLRIPLSLASGFLLALAGFFGLGLLIGAPLDIEAPVIAERVSFTRQRTPTPIENKRDPKVEREAPSATPTGPRIGPGNFDGTVAHVRPTLTKVGGIERGGGIQMGIDRDVIPLVRIDPTYPPREEARGVEGWVIVQFTVTATGVVRDAVVIESEPKSVFDEAALEAIGRWRYNPRVDRGVAVDRVGLRTLIRFELRNGA